MDVLGFIVAERRMQGFLSKLKRGKPKQLHASMGREKGNDSTVKHDTTA
jgi:hypothetical protein